MSSLGRPGVAPPKKPPVISNSPKPPGRSHQNAANLSDMFTLGGGKQGLKPSQAIKRTLGVGVPPGNVAKKTKTGPTGRSSPLFGGFSQSVPQVEAVVPDDDLADKILAMDEVADAATIKTIIITALQYMKANNNINHIKLPFFNLLLLCRKKPGLFIVPAIVRELLSILKPTGRAKSLHHMVYNLACNILHYSHRNITTWPEAFVQVFLEDTMMDRQWVDLEASRGFVENIMTAFACKLPAPPLTLMPSSPSPRTERSANDDWVEEVMDESGLVTHSHTQYDSGPSSSGTPIPGASSPAPFPSGLRRPSPATKLSVHRFNNEELQKCIKDYVMEKVNGQLKGAVTTELFKGGMKALMITCCFKEIRLWASSHLDQWLNNPSATQARMTVLELVPALVTNTTRLDNEDIETVLNMVKVKFKHSIYQKNYLEQLERLLGNNPHYVRIVLQHLMSCEVAASSQVPQNPNPAKTFDMQLLSLILNSSSHLKDAYASFAAVCLDLLVKDPQTNCSIIRRVLRRVIVKNLNHNFNFKNFVCGFTWQPPPEALLLSADKKNHFAYAIIDIVCYTCLLCISPQIMDEFNKEMTPGGRSMFDSHKALRAFQEGVADMQDASIRWLRFESHQFWPVISQGTHNFIVSKLLYLYQFDDYARPSECLDKDVKMDQKTGLDVVQNCIPVRDTTILNLTYMANLENNNGLSPLTSDHGLAMLQIAVIRAANLDNLGGNALSINASPKDIVESVLRIAEFYVRPGQPYPIGYQPPPVALTPLFWKACHILLVIGARNPSTVGAFLWQENPTMKLLIEMSIIRMYNFPPFDDGSDRTESILKAELMEMRKEKDDVMLLESLVTPTEPNVMPKVVTETNSAWVGHVMYLKLDGAPARKPPRETLVEVARLNDTLHLGDNLCCCRSPDYLLEVLERTQNTGASMNAKWLVPIVEGPGTSVDQMPIKVLSEYLFVKLLNEKDRQSKEMEGTDDSKDTVVMGEGLDIVSQVVARLQGACGGGCVKEVMGYFMAKLANKQSKYRTIAGRALNTLLYPSAPNHMGGPLPSRSLSNYAWLSQPAAEDLGRDVCLGLRAALKLETCPSTLTAYLRFLCNYFNEQDYRAEKEKESTQEDMDNQQPPSNNSSELISIIV
eukprot:Ihof_evm1s333 gene=Ihof_evmTU1s333